MQSPYKVMIVDDDTRYVAPQKDLAYTKFGLELIHYTNWEEAQTELIDNFNFYEAIIIDGKGQLSKDSKTEDESHLSVAIGWLKEQKGRGLSIPIFINTGFHDEISKYHRPDNDVIEIFQKGENQTLKMFDSVRKAVESKEGRKLENLYADVFSVFNNHYLPAEKKALLLQALIASQNQNCLKSDFNAVRELLELVYFKLNVIGVLDNKYFPSGRPNFEWCYRFLCNLDVSTPTWKDSPIGYATFPVHIGYIVNGVKNVSSVFSHSYNEEYTPYALKSITYGVMEVLLWLKKFVDTQK
ncbi:MAG: hypothetical protein IPI10_17785 [Bacteroidetes bacterium]|nr:hypothetical protein [Bacteroidota bacterium]